MKKNIFYSLSAAVLVWAGCSQEMITPEVGQEEGAELTITAAVAPETKVSLDDASLKFSWEENDKVYAVGYDAAGKFIQGAVSTLTLKSIDGSRAVFSGKGIPEAVQYRFKIANSKTSANDVFRIANTDQTQNTGSVCNVTDEMMIATSFYKNEFLATNTVLFSSHSIVMRFDVEFYPSEIGAVKSADWIARYGNNERSIRLNLTEPHQPGTPMKLWMVFDENGMNLGAGEKIALKLYGTSGTAIVSGVSDHGKEYTYNHRYHVRVSTTQEAGALSTWEVLLDAENETGSLIKVKTVGNAAPYSPEMMKVANLLDTQDADGYWVFKKNEGVFTDVPWKAFNGNTQIEEVVLGDKVTSIGAYAFEGCSNLKKVTAPASLTSIQTQAFRNCTQLLEVIGLDNVESLEENVFEGDGQLVIDVPSGLTSAESACFNGCQIRSSIIPVLGDYMYKGAKFLSSKIAVKEGTTSIPANAFYQATFLDDCQFTVPSSVITIGNAAFRESNIKMITGAEKVTSVGDAAFYKSSLTTFDFPSLQTVGQNAFGYTHVVDVVIPGTVTSMGADLFNSCPNLKTLTIQKGVKQISSNMVRYSGLQELKIYATPTECTIANNAFSWIGHTISLVLASEWETVQNGGPKDGKWKGSEFSMIKFVKVDADGNIVP